MIFVEIIMQRIKVMDYNSDSAIIDEKGRELIEHAKEMIGLDRSNPDRDVRIEEAMNAMYDYFSKYDAEKLSNFDLQVEIFEVEDMLDREFLPIQSEPVYDEEDSCLVPTEINSDEDAKKLLEYIVHQTRKERSKWNDIKNESLKQLCIDTSYSLEEICKDIGVDTVHIGINPKLQYGSFHHFTIVRVPFSDGTNKNYLADCTYRQFFTKSDSNPRRIGVMRGPAKGCSIGYFMTLNDERKKIAEELLQNGYIEATPNVIKAYFDAVLFSDRDSSYYEELGLDYLNPDDIERAEYYSAEEYLDILSITLRRQSKSITEVAKEILTSEKLCPSQEDLKQAVIEPESDFKENNMSDFESWFFS